MTKPRIIFSSYDDIRNPYYGGGGAIAVHEIAKRLTADFAVTVLTGTYPGALDETIDGVAYERVVARVFGPRLGQLIFHLVLPFLVRSRSYDVWIESFTPPFSTSGLPLFTNQPVVGLVHMLSGEDMTRKYHVPFSLIERGGLKLYKQFIVLTETFRDKVQSVNPQAKITLVSNGVTRPAPPQRDEPKDLILFIGRIEVDQKGLDLLLQAFQAVQGELPLRLMIAGGGRSNEVKKLHAQIQTLGVSDRIQVVGRISGRQKDMAFRRAVLTVVPSRYETMGLVALEALAYGVPFVAFDIEGLRWASRDYSLKVKPFDIAAFGQAMVTLANNAALRQQLSAHGQAFTQGQTWDGKAGQYVQLIRGLLASP